MTISWLNPAASFALKHRKEIQDVVAELWARFMGKHSQVAITGMEGVGKTVLLDSLTGTAFQRGYTLPPRSQAKEAGVAQGTSSRIVLTTVPGQKASPRYAALDEIFLGARPTDGVIHVVSSGFATVRNTDAVRVLRDDFGVVSLQQFRTHQKHRELEDLRETCQFIRNAHRKHRSPAWMVVAVDKVDLYHDELADVEKEYGPSSGTGFVKELNALTGHVGTDFFRWVALPVVGALESFEWNGAVRTPQIQQPERESYVAQFLQELAAYCG